MSDHTERTLSLLRDWLTAVPDEESQDFLIILAEMLAQFDLAYLPYFTKDLTKHLTHITDKFISTLTKDERGIFSADGYDALISYWRAQDAKLSAAKEKYYTDKYDKL